MQNSLSSKRLSLTKLSLGDIDFIYELVNTPEWIRFIGDRNVKTKEDARDLVQTIMNNPNVNYWVVRLHEQLIPIGIVSLVKRDYLDFFDLGFAFLPNHTKQGFAYEATSTFLQYLVNENYSPKILATTIKENVNSIGLLKKLGFQFEKRVEIENEELLLYSISIDKYSIDYLTTSFFSVFTNANQQKVNLEVINDLCLPETIIIKKSGLKEEVYNLRAFVEPRKKILTDGTLKDFEEKEINEETKIIGRIAQRFSKYEKSGYLNGAFFKQSGNKFFQFIKTVRGWKINAVVWEDEE
ncbi:MAG: GNAT family N-acetyltransferase [Bacteroidetes bacterium]|nr:GNAT family N-acetyltransferase [Bacteroidota bacterium]